MAEMHLKLVLFVANHVFLREKKKKQKKKNLGVYIPKFFKLLFSEHHLKNKMSGQGQKPFVLTSYKSDEIGRI